MRMKPEIRLLAHDADVIAPDWRTAQALLQSREWNALHLGSGRRAEAGKDALAFIAWALVSHCLPVRVMLQPESSKERRDIARVLRQAGWASTDGCRFLRIPLPNDELTARPFYPRIRVVIVGDDSHSILIRRIAMCIGGLRVIRASHRQPPKTQELSSAFTDTDLLLVLSDQMDAAHLECAASIASIARRRGILTLAIMDTRVVTPHSPAALIAAWRRLTSSHDAILAIPDYIVAVCTEKVDTPSCLDLSCGLVTGLVDALSFPTWVNLDFNALRYTLRRAGTAGIGIGIANGPDRAVVAARAAMQSLALNFPAQEPPQRLVVLIQLAPCESVQAEIQDVVSTIETHAAAETFISHGTTMSGYKDESIRVVVTSRPIQKAQKLRPELPCS